jgi:hypothetical protein
VGIPVPDADELRPDVSFAVPPAEMLREVAGAVPGTFKRPPLTAVGIEGVATGSDGVTHRNQNVDEFVGHKGSVATCAAGTPLVTTFTHTPTSADALTANRRTAAYPG